MEKVSFAMPQQLQLDDTRGHTWINGESTKPLPRLPRGWSRVCHETGLFLRSIGLGILITAFHGFFNPNFSEPEKVAIRQSRVTALLRALIHALPLGLAVFEIILNWKGRYVGDHFSGQNYLQFVAKAHEILMQASMASIVLSYTRYQLSVGKGMPFGAALGALQFFQVNYLWSVEFWSAVISKNFQLKEKTRFVVLILICVIVAATAGPSSANLLIARQGIWPKESSYLTINATFQSIWPDRLDDDIILSDCNTMTLDNAGSPDRCPSTKIRYDIGRYIAQSHVLGAYDDHTTMMFDSRTAGTDYDKAPELGSCFRGSLDQVCATCPQDTFVDAIGKMSEAQAREVWGGLEDYLVLKENYYQPYTTASCVADSVQDGSDQRLLRFPRLSDTAPEPERGQETFPVPGLTKGQSVYAIPGNISQFRVDWVDLPQEVFRTRLPGAIIVHPRSSSSLSYNITTCTLNAGWGSSSIFTEASVSQARSHMTQLPPSWPNVTTDYLDAYSNMFTNGPIFRNTSNFSYPQRRINISKGWMKHIFPTILLGDNTTSSFLSAVLPPSSIQPQEYELAWMLAVLLATALSDTGIEHHVEGFCK
ncbi:hypothetical protein MMC07_002763 [Pseudocyphellaria aurata]|nr:hypothetical protein [Pseudocyphellaria aurata]